MTRAEVITEAKHLRTLVLNLQTQINDLMDKAYELEREQGHALDLSEVAAEFGVSRSTVYRWREEEKIPEPDIQDGTINRWWPSSIRGLRISRGGNQEEP
jgi:predicted DNA-binding transcriptional regulator AlpA